MATQTRERASTAANRRAKGTDHLVERKKKLASGEIVSTKTEANLSPKQKAFIKYMVEGDSRSNAAARAGATPENAAISAYQWLQIPIVQELIAKGKEEYAITVQMTKKRVMEMHMEAFEMSKLMAEPATMVAAAREIGKLCGYYEPKKVDLNINVNGSVRLEQMNKMSDAELLKIIEQGTINAASDQLTLGMG